MARYYISDLHFFHGNILNMDGREFENITEMGEYIIDRWNSKVKEDDDVFILGDFSWEKGRKTYDLLTRLHGRLHLIEGNHDAWYLDDPNFDDFIFEDVSNYLELNRDGKTIIMSHYPIPFYNHQFQTNREERLTTYMLYGHLHNTYDEYLLNRFINEASSLERHSVISDSITTPFQMINVFCGFAGYEPLTIEEWEEVDKKRRAMINEREKECGGILNQDQWNLLNTEILDTFRKD